MRIWFVTQRRSESPSRSRAASIYMYRDRHRSGEKEGERGRLRRYLKGHRRVSSYPPVIRGHSDRRLHFLLRSTGCDRERRCRRRRRSPLPPPCLEM